LNWFSNAPLRRFPIRAPRDRASTKICRSRCTQCKSSGSRPARTKTGGNFCVTRLPTKRWRRSLGQCCDGTRLRRCQREDRNTARRESETREGRAEDGEADETKVFVPAKESEAPKAKKRKTARANEEEKEMKKKTTTTRARTRRKRKRERERKW